MTSPSLGEAARRLDAACSNFTMARAEDKETASVVMRNEADALLAQLSKEGGEEPPRDHVEQMLEAIRRGTTTSSGEMRIMAAFQRFRDGRPPIPDPVTEGPMNDEELGDYAESLAIDGCLDEANIGRLIEEVRRLWRVIDNKDIDLNTLRLQLRETQPPAPSEVETASLILALQGYELVEDHADRCIEEGDVLVCAGKAIPWQFKDGQGWRFALDQLDAALYRRAEPPQPPAPTDEQVRKAHLIKNATGMDLGRAIELAKALEEEEAAAGRAYWANVRANEYFEPPLSSTSDTPGGSKGA